MAVSVVFCDQNVAGEDLGEIGRPGVDDGDAEGYEQAQPAGEGEDQGPHRTGFTGVPGPGDEEERRQGDKLPADEQQGDVVGEEEQDDREHERRHQDVEVHDVLAMVQVARGVGEHRRTDDQGEQCEEQAQRVHAQGEFDVAAAGDDPFEPGRGECRVPPVDDAAGIGEDVTGEGGEHGGQDPAGVAVEEFDQYRSQQKRDRQHNGNHDQGHGITNTSLFFWEWSSERGW